MNSTIRPLSYILLPALFAAACGSSRHLPVPELQHVTVANLGAAVNSPSDDYAPVLSNAGRELLFTSNRPTPEGQSRGDDFWRTTRQTAGWNNATTVNEINSEGDEGGAYITPDGKTVYFVECWTADGFGDADVYTASIQNGKWERIRNLGNRINTKYWDSMPYLSPGGTELYFASDRPGGYGGTDLYVAKLLRDGSWGEPKNLGPDINTDGDEKSPVVSPGGELLYYSSNGRGGVGGLDIFVAKWVRNRWTSPANVGAPINSAGDDLYFTLSGEEDSLIISSNRGGGYGGLDLWVADRNPFKDTARYEYYVAGRVIDTVLNRNVSGAVMQWENLTTRETFRTTSGLSGNFRIRTRPGTGYAVTVTKEGFHESAARFTVPLYLSYSEYRRNIPISPLVTEQPDTAAAEQPLVVYFDFDKSDVRADAEPVLAEALSTLRTLDAYEVLLDAHTDDWGAEKYNWNLSRARGAQVSRYLAARGVPVEKISVTPHGEIQPATENRTEEGRQMNRRVEIRIDKTASAR